MAELAPGDELLVLATDREAPIDLAAWAAEAGHAYSEVVRAGWTEHRLGKAPGPGPVLP
jgi:TusA-related sulfurtransferase